MGLEARELTAPGRGAIRVLELRGADLPGRLRLLLDREPPAPGGFVRAHLRDAAGALLDEAVLVVRGPEHVELHLHGSPALVTRLLGELGAEPWRSPRTLEEEASLLLAEAPGLGAARVLLDQAEGALRNELEALLGLEPHSRLAAAAELEGRGRALRHLLTPPRVVLAGPVNAGKSTLFNLLVGRERVVVDARAGTTRDVVHERVRLADGMIELFDTAGERAPEQAGAEASIELGGQRLAEAARAQADLVLWLVPPGEAPPPPAPCTVVITSRADLDRREARERGWPSISVAEAPGEARAQIETVVREALGLPRARHVPGLGVPFTNELIEGLRTPDPEDLERRVKRWLVTGVDCSPRADHLG